MSKIEIKPVTTRKELQQFVQFFYDLYRDCKYAVPYIYSEEMSALREDKNTSFECCEAQYFMAFPLQLVRFRGRPRGQCRLAQDR